MAYTTYWHEELEDSPVEEASNEMGSSFKATIRLRVKWNERGSVLDDIVGGFKKYPRAYNSEIRAISGTCKPFKGAVGSKDYDYAMTSYEFAELSIVYALKAEGGDLISETLDPTAEFVTLSPALYRWKDSDPLTEKEAPGRVLRSMDYGVTYYRCRQLPAWLVDENTTLIGYANSDSYTAKLLGLTFSPGTLLFNPPKLSRKWNYTTYPYWEVQLKLSYRPDGWNKFWRSKTQRWEEMEVRDSYIGNTYVPFKPYELRSFGIINSAFSAQGTTTPDPPGQWVRNGGAAGGTSTVV